MRSAWSDIAEIGEIVGARRGVPRRCGPGDRQTAHRSTNQRWTDVVFGPQDVLWPGASVLYVRQAASGSRRRCTAAARTWHALGHWRPIRSSAWAGFPHRPRTDGGRERAGAQAARLLRDGLKDIEAVYQEQRSREPRAAQPEHLVQLRRRAIADHGDQGLAVSSGSACTSASLEPPTCCARWAATTNSLAQLDPLLDRPLHDRRGDRLHHHCCAEDRQAARTHPRCGKWFRKASI